MYVHLFNVHPAMAKNLDPAAAVVEQDFHFHILYQKVWPLARHGPRGPLDFFIFRIFSFQGPFQVMSGRGWRQGGSPLALALRLFFMSSVCFTRGRGGGAHALNSQRRHFTSSVCYLFTKPILPPSPAQFDLFPLLLHTVQVCRLKGSESVLQTLKSFDSGKHTWLNIGFDFVPLPLHLQF